MELIRRLPRRMPAISGRIPAISDWAIWRLPRWLTVFVLAVIAANLAAIGVAAPLTTFHGHDFVLYAVRTASRRRSP